MKPRIPILDTIGHGFYFGLTRFFTLLRITWFPALLAGAVFATQVTVGVLSERGAISAGKHLSEYIALVGYIPLYSLLVIPAVVAFRMAVFNKPAPGGIAYFRFGGTELQFVAAQLVTTAYMISFLIVAFVAVFAASIGSFQWLSHAPTAATGFAAAMDGITLDRLKTILLGASIAFFALSFFGNIMFSLVQPVIVAEKRINVWKSLRLLWLGNGVRLTIVWAVVGVTFAYLAAAAFGLLKVYGPLIVYTVLPNYNKEHLSHLLFAWSVLAYVPTVLIATLALGVTAGINGFAYRLLALMPDLGQRDKHGA